jgi:hypothetical protein
LLRHLWRRKKRDAQRALAPRSSNEQAKPLEDAAALAYSPSLCSTRLGQ